MDLTYACSGILTYIRFNGILLLLVVFISTSMFMVIYSTTAYSRNTRICTKIVRLFCRGTLIVMRIVIRVYE